MQVMPIDEHCEEDPDKNYLDDQQRIGLRLVVVLNLRY